MNILSELKSRFRSALAGLVADPAEALRGVNRSVGGGRSLAQKSLVVAQTAMSLVLLHAFPCDGRMWEPQAHAAVSLGWRVLVPDLPGFGASTLIDSEPDLAVVAAALITELEERGVDRCILGGVSLGGYVAMAVLRSRPDLVAAVLLCDTKATADSDARVVPLFVVDPAGHPVGILHVHDCLRAGVV